MKASKSLAPVINSLAASAPLDLPEINSGFAAMALIISSTAICRFATSAKVSFLITARFCVASLMVFSLSWVEMIGSTFIVNPGEGFHKERIPA